MMALIDRFQGQEGRRLLLEELRRQKLIENSAELAAEVADRAEILEVAPATLLIEQDAGDNDIYLILAGVCDVVINGRPMAVRGPGDCVGEMAAIQPSQRRSASVIPRESTIVAKLAEPAFADLASRYPEMYRAIARELARRLEQRNSKVGAFRDGIRVFIISSLESLGVARTIENAFEHDPISPDVWASGTFKASHYTVENLEEAIDRSDFAIAIAHADDVTSSRGQDWPSPRDNVIFELGLFMGRLGRKRAILMEPREEKLKLPSDLTGITTIPYQWKAGRDAASSMGPACNKLRDHILELGPNNG
jgi:predicted nucleotide-binding protein